LTVIKNIKSLSEIAEQYELFIIDQWGVMHDGQQGYSFAIKCIKKLIELKKKLIIISNSSKRKKTSIERLSKLGFDKNDFSGVITSGEMIWQNLYKKKNFAFKKLGKRCFHLFDNTNPDEEKYIEGLDYDFVKSISDADFILGCSTVPRLTTLDYVPLLEQAIQRNIPFVCANPDFETVESTSKHLIICMGSVAELYKDFGGFVMMMGKPSIEIYKEITKNFVNIKKTKMIAIGDSIYHDIQGAISFGIDSILITSGIHKSCFNQNNPKWDQDEISLDKFHTQPTYLCSKFKF